MSKSVVLCGYKRSPFTFASKGGLSQTRPDDMSAAVIKALLDDTGIDPQDCEDLLMGNAFPEAEQGFNLGRIVGQLAGLPAGVAGATLNRFCGSSMTTIHMAAGYLQLGAGEAYITAGVESMTRVPMGGFNPMPNPSLMESYPQAYISMGETAENLAKKYDITRKAQDEFAYESHSKAASAREKSNFDDEIIEVDGVGQDGCIRPDTSVEKLGELSPAFDSGGSVTAGTSAPLTDGAAAVLVASEDYAKQNGIPILARVRSVAVAGCAAEIMGIGPVSAANKALDRAGLALGDMDIIELNEAFAAQSLAVIEELDIDRDKLNLDGGAIALGHPLGASGARISGKLASLLNREDKQLGLATMCVGGGQGTAIVLERAA
jgi:acetyl-CoA acyltransferase